MSSTSSTSSTSKDDRRLQELFQQNLILLEPIIRRKMRERQHLISLLKNKSRSFLTRIDEENDNEKKRNKEI